MMLLQAIESDRFWSIRSLRSKQGYQAQHSRYRQSDITGVEVLRYPYHGRTITVLLEHPARTSWLSTPGQPGTSMSS